MQAFLPAALCDKIECSDSMDLACCDKKFCFNYRSDLYSIRTLQKISHYYLVFTNSHPS